MCLCLVPYQELGSGLFSSSEALVTHSLFPSHTHIGEVRDIAEMQLGVRCSSLFIAAMRRFWFIFIYYKRLSLSIVQLGALPNPQGPRPE